MKTDKLKITAVSSTRADYGIMRPLLLRLEKAEWCELKVVATGTHLLEKYGNTINEIERDNLSIDKVSIIENDSTADIMANTVKRFDEYFNNHEIDVVLLLGDRYEIFEVASACVINNLPIIHIAGGETTEGAIDEVFRHSITKMSYLHLASTEVYKNRIIQLGEDPERVFNTGAMGVENVLNVKCLSKEELSKELDFDLDKEYAVVTFHPVTMEQGSELSQLNELLKVIENHPEINFIITKSNVDKGGSLINDKWDEFGKIHDNVKVFASLGMLRYFSAIKYCSYVIGNSSSGIVEVPSFKVPTINIGDRQMGRIQSTSIINCKPVSENIERALEYAKSEEYKNVLAKSHNPYERECPSRDMLEIIKDTFYGKRINLKKSFYDLEFEE
ncbi:MAG: UDP-N-acetylglucosamine 2-epimerase [Erysipelotrichaceae bacterium]|nr:UDP-N-acetylglucosamine 2-epimerase [Erysipelotrichaceae bacterium]